MFILSSYKKFPKKKKKKVFIRIYDFVIFNVIHKVIFYFLIILELDFLRY